MLTLSQLLQTARLRLTPIAGDVAALEARTLAEHAWGKSREDLLREAQQQASAQQIEALERLLVRRLTHEPISQILGEKFFWKDSFRVTADVLTPRPDSETILEAMLRHCPQPEAIRDIADFGLGTGCLLLSALREYPDAGGVGVDISPAALAVAKENAARLGLSERIEFFLGEWCKPLDKTQKFDILISNPPYIPRAEIDALAEDVRCFEPHLALDGGVDGLDCYRTLLATLPAHTHPSSRLFLEVGAGQAEDVAALGASMGWENLEIVHDLGGIARVVVLFYPTR